jgi:Nif-specific regulatory protein
MDGCEAAEAAFIAESSAMKEKLLIIKSVAASNSSIWLLGAAGCGKEYVARHIHAASKQKYFIHINCAAAARDEGSFSCFTENSTIFLDEISCLPLRAQDELLTILNKKSACGRFIASTKSDIEKMITEDRFLRELYYKLNVLPIFIPPLCDRREDIIPLAEYLLRSLALESKQNVEGFTSEAKEALLAYNWPGNIRELKNTIERAMLKKAVATVADSPLLYKEDLFDYNIFSFGRFGVDISLREAVDFFKAFFIEKTLNDMRGNKTAAAKKLDIERTYLSKLIKDLKIDLSLNKS